MTEGVQGSTGGTSTLKPREQVHEGMRIAAVVHAAAVTLDAETALA